METYYEHCNNESELYQRLAAEGNYKFGAVIDFVRYFGNIGGFDAVEVALRAILETST